MSGRSLTASAREAIYITATALGKLGHPDGEKNLTWAAAEQGVIQVRPKARLAQQPS